MESKSYFDEILVGDLQLPNRIMMAALTRCRADPQDGVPNDAHVKYYSDRADFGIILTECSQVAPMGEAFPGSCGIYSEQQTAGWKRVVDKVHEQGGRIFLQIWHCGRATHTTINRQKEIWGPSPIAIQSEIRGVPHEVPKEMTQDDIKQLIQEFRVGAENAKKAGFDGLQLHGAHGYIIDQFLKDNCNKRKDDYGGSVENRSRLCLQVIDELIKVFGNQRVGIQLSPCAPNNDAIDSDPVALYSYLIPQLNNRGIAFIQFNQLNYTNQIPNACQQFRNLFSGTFVANWGYDVKTGIQIIKSGASDMVSFGQLAISNPDLIFRIKNNLGVNSMWDAQSFYPQSGQIEPGYNDYPTYKQQEAATEKQQ